jgi:hypothetical protein
MSSPAIKAQQPAGTGWVQHNDPHGFSVDGSLYRLSKVDVRNQVVAVSQDWLARLQVGDAGLSGFQLPTPNVEQFHMRFPNVALPPGEGQKITLPIGLTFVVMRYRTGA